MENRKIEEAEKALKAKKESKEKWAVEEENICAHVQAAQAAAEAVLKTPFTKETSSATSKKQRMPIQRLVTGVQGEVSEEVMSPRAGDALIAGIAQCIARDALPYLRPQTTQMAIVSLFQQQMTQSQVRYQSQRVSQTQARMTMMTMTTMMTTTQIQATVSASQNSDIIVLERHCVG